jgi:uncharacterized protein (DUF58 family)
VPLAALVIRLTPHRFSATRRSSARGVFPGTEVRVDVEVRNDGPARTSFVLVEDRLPADLGTAARAVLAGVPPRGRQTVSYAVTPRARGRYELGPLSASVTDPFDLTRRRLAFPERLEVLVYPEVEELGPTGLAIPVGGAGDFSTRRLHRTGEDFYTMRAYEVGDDLRRIHWPSVARTGELMIRQDEAARRSQATLFLDTRRSSLPQRPLLEKAVSAAASLGVRYLRSGFSVRLATPDLEPAVLERDRFLETLALARWSRSRSLVPALRRLRRGVTGSPSLLVVTHPPTYDECSVLLRTSTAYGPKLAVLLLPGGDLSLPDRRDLERRLEHAHRSLAREGWEVLTLPLDASLRHRWQRRAKRPARATAASW